MQLKHYFCGLFFLGSTVTNAQDSQTALFLELTPQPTRLNLSSRPAVGFFGMPVVGDFRVLMGNSIAHPIHWISQENQMVPATLSLDAVQQSFSGRNDLNIDIQWDWLSAGGFSANRRSFWEVSISEHIESCIELPEDLLRLPFTGNVHETILEDGPLDFSSLGLQFSHRREFAAVWQYEWNEKWSSGIRLAYLQGLSFAGTRDNTLQWMVDPNNYAWKVQGGIGLDIAGLSSLRENSSEQIKDYLHKKGNYGMSTDISIEFKPSERVRGFAQLSDLGYLRWKSDVQNWNVPHASMEFTGVALNNISSLNSMSSDSLKPWIESTVNSWDSALIPDTSTSAFTQKLLPKLSLGFAFNAFEAKKHKGTLGAWVRSNPMNLWDWRFSYNHRFGQWLGVSMSWGVSQSQRSTWGTAVSMNLGRIAVFLASDHIGFSRWSRIHVSSNNGGSSSGSSEFLLPNEAHTMQIQMGLTWRFISKKKRQQKVYNRSQSEASKGNQANSGRKTVHPGSVPCDTPGQWED